jgi:hypothetical protein
VADYCEQFLSLLARVGKLSQSQQVQLFTVGLQPPLSIDVQIQAPQSLDMAMSLARSYELREQTVTALPCSSHSSTRPALLPAPATPLPLPAPPSTQGTTTTTTCVAPTTQVAGRTARRLSPSEIYERRRMGQCFNCDEKYVRGHNQICKRLFLLELSEEHEDKVQLEVLQISLSAITGISSSENMQIMLRIGSVQLRALLDSGSSHNFISEKAATMVELPLQGRANLFATVANGERVQCAGVFKNTTFCIAKDQF